jgi:hypothetical protein
MVLIGQIVWTESALISSLFPAPKHLISFHGNGVCVISSCEDGLGRF